MDIASNVSTTVTRPSGPEVTETGRGRSETEESKKNGAFNFMDYLLGLQTSPPPAAESLIGELTPESSSPPESLEVTIPKVTESSPDARKALFREEEAPEGDSPSALSSDELVRLFSETEAGDMDAPEEMKQAIQSYLEMSEAEESAPREKLEVRAPSPLPESVLSQLSSDYVGTEHGPTAVETGSGSESGTRDISQLFEGVKSLVQQGGGKMSVSLNPEHLGEMEIEVETRGNRVSIEMVSESPAAKALIESQLSDLKTAMMGQDLILSRVHVQVGDRSFGSHLAGDGGRGYLGRERSGASRIAMTEVASGAPAARFSRGAGRLDISI